MKLFLAVIADVIKSRKSQDVPGISEQLLNVNDEIKSELLVPFKCLRGDEIEAVIAANGNFMKIIRTLKYRLQPRKLRVGLGVGVLDANPNNLPGDPFLLNGEAFFAARKAIDLIKNEYKEQESIVLRSYENTEGFDTWDIIFRMYSSIINRWNADQWDASMKYEQLGSMEKGAIELNKRRQSIQRSLERADWRLVNDCEAWMKRQMKKLCGDLTQRSHQS